MTSKDNNNIHQNFDIIDFDLNEITEDTPNTSEELTHKEPAKESTDFRSEVVNAKLNASNNTKTDEPNRDMLKTILFILLLVVVACLFLGLISFIVNLSGNTGKGRERTETSTDYKVDKDLPQENNTPATEQTKNEQSKEDKEKEEFEESIKDITNTVIDDMKDEDDEEPEQPKEPTTEPDTETATEAPATEATTEATTEASTEATTEAPTTENSTEAPEDTNIDALPEE